ncbi:MAG: CPBP family intramembrane metalloprotease [Lachnospiraceae bacterium]|nr:CPBP family intramembrane metalloprotease [Lachnospiraceae bacterium]
MKRSERNHIICEKAPVIAMILSMLMITFIISMFSGKDSPTGYLIECGVALLVIVAFRWWFSPGFKGCMRTEVSPGEVLVLCLPYVLRIIADTVYTGVENDWYFEPTVKYLCMALSAGIVEESMFRVFSIPIGMRYLKSRHKIMIIVSFISLVFGLMHLANLSEGNPSMVVVQAFVTMLESIFFCAIYLRSGSIIPSMVLHGVYDWTCFVFDPTLENGILVAEMDIRIIWPILFSLAAGIVGSYMIRPVMHEKIERIWQDKWGLTGES